jgi:hypothetical protein
MERYTAARRCERNERVATRANAAAARQRVAGSGTTTGKPRPDEDRPIFSIAVVRFQYKLRPSGTPLTDELRFKRRISPKILQSFENGFAYVA